MKSNFSEVSMNDLLDIENSLKTTEWSQTTEWSEFINPNF
jgi:hypothetical protein